MPTLDVDIRQLFAHAVLETLERADEAEVGFTYRAGDVYLSAFAEAFARLEDRKDIEYDPDLLRLAQVFERFLTHPKPSVAPLTAGLMAAGLYWLAGYSANALVMTRAVRRGLNAEPTLVVREEGSGVMPARLFLGLLLRDLPPVPDTGEGALVAQALAEYLRPVQLTRATAPERRRSHLRSGNSSQELRAGRPGRKLRSPLGLTGTGRTRTGGEMAARRTRSFSPHRRESAAS